MGTVIWQGDAPTVAQVSAGSIDSLDGTPAANTFTVTIGGLAISQVGTGTVATTAAALVVLLNASTDKRFSTITWTVPSGSTIRGTAKTAGIPFTAVLTETGAGTGAVTDFAVTTANASPNDVTTASNWDTGVVPADSDDVIIENSSVSLLYGLAQSSIDLTSLLVRSTFTGTIGLPRTNVDGYVEYRPTYWQIGSASTSINATGSGRIKIDNGTDQGDVSVYGSGQRSEVGVPSILLLGTHASQAVTVNKGDVGIGFFGGEAATVSLLTVRGGVCYPTTSGTVATLLVTSGGVVDYRQDGRARTVTNCSIYKGGAIYDSMATVTWTNGIDLQQCAMADVTLDLGTHRTWTPSAI